jgi:rubredoxin
LNKDHFQALGTGFRVIVSLTESEAVTMEYRSWMCVVCGWIYEEEDGLPDDGIAPGTRWEDIPDDFVCPECGAGKSDFEMIEI